IWIARFEGQGRETPPLNTVLYEEFEALRTARAAVDAEIETFFAEVRDEFLTRTFPYTNNQGRAYVETATVAVAHFFNHQTHHRGQVHVMLSQTSVAPPPLDLHRIMNP